MSDAVTRALERRLATSGDPEVALAWLAQRVRAGALDARRLSLAAYLGDPAARAYLGDRCPRPPGEAAIRRTNAVINAMKSGLDLGHEAEDHGPAFAWAVGLRRFDTKAMARSAIAAARRLRDEMPQAHRGSLDLAIAAATSWALAPSARAAKEARDVERLVRAEACDRYSSTSSRAGWRLAATAMECALTAARGQVGVRESAAARASASNAASAVFAGAWRLLAARRTSNAPGIAFSRARPHPAAEESATADLLAAVRDEVAPWALGRCDPLAERAPAPAALPPPVASRRSG